MRIIICSLHEYEIEMIEWCLRAVGDVWREGFKNEIRRGGVVCSLHEWEIEMTSCRLRTDC